ncbi:MAG: histidine kinase [Cellulophaga sp.]
MNKKTIKHLLFWILISLLWSARDLIYNQNFFQNIKTNVYTFFPYAILVYFNLYVLIPKLLLAKKRVVYVSFLLVGLFLTTLLSSWSLDWYFIKINNLGTASFFASYEGKLSILTELLVIVGISMTFYFFNEWNKKEKYSAEIEKKKLEAELHQLKSQINPHFLFNSLNSIYIMLGINLELGKETLLQFSDLLSHQIYENNKERVMLSKEIENLKNYIKIEKIRHEDFVKLDYKFPTVLNNSYVTPMLFLPIIENAFKHGQSNDDYWISIKMEVLQHDILNLIVENSLNIKKETQTNNHGIGLNNVKRRLELIYPKNHKLSIEKKETSFKVNLKLKLYDSEMPNS